MIKEYLRAAFFICVLLSASACAKHEGERKQSRSEDLQAKTSPYMVHEGKPLLASTEPLVFHFDESFPEEFKGACIKAGTTWNKALGTDVFLFDDEIKPYNKESDDISVISWGKSEPLAKASHAAETYVVFISSRIVEADIDFDLRHFEYTVTNEAKKLDVESVCLHEMGHALGLGHVDEEDSIMFDTLTVGVPKRGLSRGDVKTATQPREERVAGG